MTDAAADSTNSSRGARFAVRNPHTLVRRPGDRRHMAQSPRTSFAGLGIENLKCSFGNDRVLAFEPAIGLFMIRRKGVPREQSCASKRGGRSDLRRFPDRYFIRAFCAFYREVAYRMRLKFNAW